MKNQTNTSWPASGLTHGLNSTFIQPKYLFSTRMWHFFYFCIPSINCSFRKPKESFFFCPSPTKPNSGNCSRQLGNKSTTARRRDKRRSKRTCNSTGAAAQQCLVQDYHKALVLFSKGQQWDFRFSAFFSLLARELVPTAESVVKTL